MSLMGRAQKLGSPNLTYTCCSALPQVSPARCWLLSTTEVPREMLVSL